MVIGKVANPIYHGGFLCNTHIDYDGLMVNIKVLSIY